MMVLTQGGKSFKELTRLFNNSERRSTVEMNGDVLCNRCIIRVANITLRAHAMSHQAKLPTPITIV
jgi:hypothetical protein